MTESIDIDDVGNAEDEEKENGTAYQEFRKLFEGIQIFVFQQSADCEEYVRQHSENSFLIIVSRQLVHRRIGNIHNLENIKSIYIYCRSQNCEAAWMQNFGKVNYTIHIQCSYFKDRT